MTRIIKIVPLVVLCALIIAVPSVGANWVTDGVALCTATGGGDSPQVISDGAGGAIVTWEDGRSGNLDIFAQRVNASGAIQWTANGVALCIAKWDQGSPQITSDGAGGAIVTWYDQRSGINEDIYAQKVNASGAVQWTPGGVLICTATGDQWDPRIVSDGAGGAIITWIDGCCGNYDIYAQRVNASGAVQWAPDGVAICTATGEQQNPMVTSDGAGGAIITWYDNRGGSDWDIYAQSVNASGTVQWTADGIAICAAAGDQYNPTIASDGASGAIITWWDHRSGTDYDIYAQRVDASGAVQWTADGVALCTATRDQRAPLIVSDGTGGAIVTWRDYRNGDGYDIYAERVNASGASQWTADGVAICTATGWKQGTAIVSDGAGGAIVTWQDGRSGRFDIYAQRVNASGVDQWTSDGVALCKATGDQQDPAIVSDGLGGAIVTWCDVRSGTYPGIYGQRVDANGFAVLTGADAPVVSMELHQNYPNPFNPTTTITYSVPEKCDVTLKVYDISGKCVASLVDERQEKSSYAVEWHGKDAIGSTVASGIYFYRLAAGNHTITKKMVLLR